MGIKKAKKPKMWRAKMKIWTMGKEVVENLLTRIAMPMIAQ